MIIKVNKFLIVLLIFTLILGIGCVSAAESTQDTVTNDDQISISTLEDQNTVNLQETNGCNATNFNQLTEYLKTHEVVELENNIKRQNGEISIVINKDVVIDGKGHTIDANKLGRIFQVSKGTLTLKNLNLINGYDAGDGGAIHSQDTVVCYNCTFNNNVAGDNGGAIIAVKNVILYNCEFESNKAKDDNGGAIYCMGNIDGYNTSFCNNHAYWDGGAIFCDNKVTMKDCNFLHNLASDASRQCYGGAIRSKGTTECYNSVFRGNVAEDYGGAIYGNNVIVIDSIFDSNRAEDNDGGAIYSDGGVKCINSTFKNNQANVHGGAIYSKGFVECKNSTFNDNCCKYTQEHAIAQIDGGAIFAKKIYVNNSKFKNNLALSLGGAIYAREVQEISHSKFESNTAIKGGAVYVHNACTFKISDCEFNDNDAYKSGGAVYIDSRKTHITVHHNIFIDNGGCTIYNYGYYDCIDHNYYGTPDPDFNRDPGIFVEHKGLNIFSKEVKHFDRTYFKTLEDYYNYVEKEGDTDPWDSTIYENSSENNPNSMNNDNNNAIHMEQTGLPLIAILLAILVIPIIRFKK